MRAPRLRGRSFVVYYGYGPLPEITAYDIAILEPAGWTDEDLRELGRRGVERIAYLSALEATRETLRAVGVGERELVRVGSGPWHRAAFDTYVVDPRSARWRAHVVQEARRLVAQGWDGVFLDSLGDVEDEAVSAQTAWLVPAAADLVRQVREAARDKLLVQNNGIFLLLPLVAKLLDGICWEGAFDPQALEGPWLRMVLEQLVGVVREEGVVPMLLSEIPEDADSAGRLTALRELGRRYGFLTYAAPLNYAQGIRTISGEVVRGR